MSVIPVMNYICHYAFIRYIRNYALADHAYIIYVIMLSNSLFDRWSVNAYIIYVITLSRIQSPYLSARLRLRGRGTHYSYGEGALAHSTQRQPSNLEGAK